MKSDGGGGRGEDEQGEGAGVEGLMTGRRVGAELHMAGA